MHKSSRSLGRTTSDDATSTAAVTDGIETISAQFDTSPVRITLVESSVASAESSAGSPVEAPALTRRELREREARDAQKAPRQVLFEAPAVTPETSAAAGVEPPATRRSTSAARKAAGSKRTRSSRASGADVRRTKAPRPTVTRVPSGKARAGAQRGILSRLVTVGAMSGVGLILIATTVPANAFVRPDSVQSSAVSTQAGAGKTQEMEVQSVAAPAISRDAYTVVPLARQVQAMYGSRVMSFTNNPNGTIQWPFIASPITSGFGSRRVAGCGFCSTNHKGLDFNPGAGTPIGSVADGVVSLVANDRGGLGSHVIVDHVINGQKVQSVYAHMTYGSITVATGQAVTVGQPLGTVGSTGASTGAHLHLEIHLDGTPVDPFSWLQANAN